MRKNYVEPSIKIIAVTTADIIAASENEVFVDGEDLFD